MSPPKKDDISREKTILMTSLRIFRASAVSSPGLHYTCLEPDHNLADNFLRIETMFFCIVL
jgi:hypothetical protein